MSDTAATLVTFRDPRPPHGAYLAIHPADVRYSFKVRKPGTAVFQVRRTDPNVAANLDKMLPGEPPMITIDRPDGLIPWVGFVTNYSASLADPNVTFYASDHAWRVAAPHGARSRKNALYKAASGVVIRNVFLDMEDRGEPAPLLKYDDVGFGPGANFEVRADYGLDILEGLARQCDFEWGFSYNISPAAVETHLNWVARLGVDRRDEEIWSEQKHFVAADYNLSYANGIKSAVVIGGSGAFSARPAAVASATGSAPDLLRSDIAIKKAPASPYGLGGTRIAITEQITDLIVLKQQATQMHAAPEYAVEQIGLTAYEAALDMARFGLGDIRTIRLQTTALGVAIERTVRIIGVQMKPSSGTIDVETQVI